MDVAAKLADTLVRLDDQKIVFAESCTCGMAAALLGAIPGISKYFCGSQVVYWDGSKIEWLDFDADYLVEVTSTSAEASQELAIAVLKATPEATWSAAITGHLGPVTDGSAQDGVAYLCIAVRGVFNDEDAAPEIFIRADEELQLEASGRRSRQVEAAELLLSRLAECLQEL